MIREPKVAGAFYPGDKEELASIINRFLKKVKKDENLKALILPHAGYIYSGPIAGKGYSVIPEKFKKVILLGPSHQVRFHGGAFDSNEEWETPLGKSKLFKIKSNMSTNATAHAYEHSIEVQLPFIQTVLKNARICPISISSFAENLIDDIINSLDEETLIIVSSDLSHYNPYEMAINIDRKTIDKILKRNPAIEHDEACGADGINTLIKIAKELQWKPKLIDYRNSGDTAGDKSGVVGYAAIAFGK